MFNASAPPDPRIAYTLPDMLSSDVNAIQLNATPPLGLTRPLGEEYLGLSLDDIPLENFFTTHRTSSGRLPTQIRPYPFRHLNSEALQWPSDLTYFNANETWAEEEEEEGNYILSPTNPDPDHSDSE